MNRCPQSTTRKSPRGTGSQGTDEGLEGVIPGSVRYYGKGIELERLGPRPNGLTLVSRSQHAEAYKNVIRHLERLGFSKSIEESGAEAMGEAVRSGLRIVHKTNQVGLFAVYKSESTVLVSVVLRHRRKGKGRNEKQEDKKQGSKYI